MTRKELQDLVPAMTRKGARSFMYDEESETVAAYVDGYNEGREAVIRALEVTP